MNRSATWLRISYWAGALIDVLAAVQMLVPGIFAATNQLTDFDPPFAYRYAMGMGASLMLGWTVLLVWASRRPVERKVILLITIFPVIVGMVLNEIGAVSAQFITAGALAPVWIMQAVLIVLFGFSYLYASRSENAKQPARAM